MEQTKRIGCSTSRGLLVEEPNAKQAHQPSKDFKSGQFEIHTLIDLNDHLK